jgi:quercetin dioxygenase-like cupin family protein
MKFFKFTQADKDFRAVDEPAFKGWHIITMADRKAVVPTGVDFSRFEVNKVKIEAGREDQYHHHKYTYDLFILEKGALIFLANDKEVALQPGDAVLMEPGDKHKPMNHGKEPAIFLEVRFNVTEKDRFAD